MTIRSTEHVHHCVCAMDRNVCTICHGTEGVDFPIQKRSERLLGLLECLRVPIEEENDDN